MIGNKLQENDNIKPNSLEMKKLKEVFPQYFNNKGEFELYKFKDFLKQEEVDISKEGYELKFLGKSYAKYLSSLETETYISPDMDHNLKEENKNSGNLYIVGDNIDALKHLLSSYAGQIKCIYIDPPYNTGSDGFVYPDNFQFRSDELSEKIGITEEEAQRILNLAGKSTHSAWLTFMYPRLVLARDLLSDEGVIFISIDDNEQANLKLMCDEIYGEENFIGTINWKGRGGRQDSEFIAAIHEHIHIYSRNQEMFVAGEEVVSGATYNKYDENKDKFYKTQLLRKWGSNSLREDRPNLYYPIPGPDNIEVYPRIYDGDKVIEGCWRWGKSSMKTALENDEVEFVNVDGNIIPYERIYQPEEGEDKTKKYVTWINDVSNGTKEIKNLFGNKVFEFPKSTELIKKFVKFANCDNEDIILDFFSGSATTADTVMQLNVEDKTNRNYIMVQLPETIKEKTTAYREGYRSIDEVGRARIEKAAKKIKKVTDADIDYGYKLYYLETINKKTLVKLENFEPEIKLITEDMISVFDNEHSSGKESILSTWLNEDGYGLTNRSKPYLLDSYQADLVEKSLYLINDGIEEEDVMTLIKKIENEKLDITRVVVYVHSVRFNVLQELRKNLKVLRNNKNVTLIERY